MGTWSYSDPALVNVPAARRSLDRTLRLLSGPLCGWPVGRVRVYSNRVSPGNLPDELVELYSSTVDVALFYYVGHGLIDDEDQLCLTLVNSLTKAERRATTSLPWSAVRRALQTSNAKVKIVLLDCCFSGQATRSDGSLAEASQLIVADQVMIAGAYTIAATGPYSIAWFQPDDADGHGAQTYFSKFLADVIEEGIPGEPAELSLDSIFFKISERSVMQGKPQPTKRASDLAGRFPLARNAAPVQVQRDLAKEVAELQRRLDAAAQAMASMTIEHHEVSKELAEARAELTAARHGVADADEAGWKLEHAVASASKHVDNVELTAQSLLTDAAREEIVDAAAKNVPTTSSTARQPLAEVRASPLSNSPAATREMNGGVPQANVSSTRRLAFAAGVAALLLMAAVVGIWQWKGPYQYQLGDETSANTLSTISSTAAAPITVTTTESASLPKQSSGISDIAYSPDAKILATADFNGVTRFWDTGTFKEVGKSIADPSHIVLGLAFSPDGKILATSTDDGPVRLWDIITRKQIGSALPPTAQHVLGVAFSPDGTLLATAGDDSEVRLWDLHSFKQIGDIHAADSSSVAAVAFSPDGSLLATGSAHEGVKLWNTASHKQVGDSIAYSAQQITDVAFSPNGNILAIGSSEGQTTSLWDVKSHMFLGKPLFSHIGNMSKIHFFPDSRIVATCGSYNGPAEIWDAASQTRLGNPLPTRDDHVYAVAIAPDGKTLVTGSESGRTSFWKLTISG
jgi:WD40 repeat protein